MARVCLVGAGAIARVHAEALLGHRIVAVVDPDADAAQRLARRHGAATYGSVSAALAAGGFERAHVLTPPPLHAATAQPLLAAGIAVLVEKPLAASAADCRSLLAAAASGGAVLGVNQNFLHHPAFVRLRARLDARAYGPPRCVAVVYHVALRQLAARQFGHWMFAAPKNLLLEQAVHPLSQLRALTGPVRELRVLADPARTIAPGVPFCRGLSVALRGAGLPAQLRFAVGASFPLWQLSVVCDDGVLTADMLADRLTGQGRTRWLEPVDALVSGLRRAGGLAGESVANAGRYLAATARRRRSDPFFRSMQASIAAFHAAADAGQAPQADGRCGAELVELCERMAAHLPQAGEARRPEPHPQATRSQPPAPAMAILGGTGFIGAHLMQLCRDRSLAVRVMARSTETLPALYHHPDVSLHRGDIRDPAAVAAAIAGCAIVINLAHGGGGESWAAVRGAMVGGAETLARACLAAGTQRLIHLSSLAALYLGPQPQPVTGATPPDPQAHRRADYARAKAESERRLLALHATAGLPVVILRPGIVVGAGATPFHSGLGAFNTEQHCIGWNRGRNPLPFVLADDVAAGILAAIAAPGIAGRCYNLVGDVRPSARAYLADLARALERPLRYHPQSPAGLWLEDWCKYLIKRAAGRRAALPSLRDLRSRGMRAVIDCDDAKRDLGWQPVAEAAAFHRRAVLVHAAAAHSLMSE